MNYKKIYENLINRAKNRKIEGYKEVHHIVPRCMGGRDNTGNLVSLTPEEHYVAHQLLVKIYPENFYLKNAVLMMTVNRPSNKLYAWVRREVAKAQRHNQLGNKNSQYGTKWIYNINQRETKKILKTEEIPVGWIEGRILNFDLLEKKCEVCGNFFYTQKKIKYCSDSCKKESTKTEAMKIIDDNLNEMICVFQKNKSIDKTLKSFGIKGHRAGNSYFSKILKQNGYSYLIRRTSKLRKKLPH